MKIKIPAMILMLALVHCGGKDPFYMKQQPILFGENIISTEKYEFSCCLSANNKVIIFSTNGWDSTDILNQDLYYSEFHSGQWQKPQPMPFNTKWNEFDPELDEKNQILYFCSNRPGGMGGDDIWSVRWDIDQRSEPVNLGTSINSKGDEWGPSISKNGKFLFFSSDGFKGFGQHDIFFSEWQDGAWCYPVNLGGAINSTRNDFDPCIVGNPDKIIFASDREGGIGKVDIWQTRHKKNAWTDPSNLGPRVNSPDWDYAPFLTRNGKMFFFTGIGRVPERPWGDIWMIEKK